MKEIVLITFVFLISCSTNSRSIHQVQSKANIKNSKINLTKVEIGLDALFKDYLYLIKNKSVGLVTNHTGLDQNGVPNYRRLMSYSDVDLKIIFSPEHGLFGEAAAGEKVNYNKKINELPEVVSLYGKNRAPTKDQLSNLDVIIYDIQDVGARFYTYITTLGLVMEQASLAAVDVIVLDRPNPISGQKIEGPILNIKYQSFIGYYPIPIQYGLTVGELANMINGENWIKEKPNLTVVPMKRWNRRNWLDDTDVKWVNPSPNIPDLQTAIIYPGMCLLESTNLNEGRGTQKPFKRFGAPWINKQQLAMSLNELKLNGVVFKPVSYIPIEIKGMSINPKFKNQVCNGIEIIVTDRNQYNSIKTAVSVLALISQLYPEKLKINDASIKRLWGKDNFSNILSSENKLFNHSELDSFRELSKEYYLYE